MSIINKDNVEEFKSYILAGKTIPELENIYNCTRSTITSAKKKYGLIGLSPNIQKRDNGDGTKTCNICFTAKPVNEFYSNGFSPAGNKKLKPACISCENNSNNIKYYLYLREELSKQGRDYKCELCGYDSNYAALTFHHHTQEKNFQFSSISKTTRTGVDIPYELSICKVLCSNCHSEIHNPTLSKDLLNI